MKEEIRVLIQQNLPALAAGELKEYIEQAEKTKKGFDEVSELLGRKLKELSAAQTELSAYKAEAAFVLDLKSELDEKEKALNLKEFNLKVAELTYQLEAEKKSKDSIYNLVNTFVANPRAIETINKNRCYQHGMDYSPTGGSHHYPVSHFETETRETKEIKGNG